MTCHYFQTTGNSYFLKSLTHCSFSSKFTDEGERYLKYSWCHPSVVPSVLLSHLWKTQLFVLWGFFPSKLLQMSLFLSSNIKYNSWAVQIQLSSNFHMTWVRNWDFLLFPRTKLLPIPGPFDFSCAVPFTSPPSGQVLLLGVSTYFISNSHLHIWPPCQAVSWPFLPHRHLSRAVLSLAVPAAQPSTVKLEKSCSSWRRSSHLWAIKFFHSLKVRTAKLQKHLRYLSFCRFLFFSLPMQNSHHCQRDLKQQVYFSCSAAWCQITSTIQKNLFQRLVYWWVFSIIFHS